MASRFEGLMSAQIDWAHEYDGYARLAGSPQALATLLETAWRQYHQTGRVPEWCGVDILRGWAFYLTRADRHGGGYGLAEGGPMVQEWNAVLERIATHEATGPGDTPPLPDAPGWGHSGSTPEGRRMWHPLMPRLVRAERAGNPRMSSRSVARHWHRWDWPRGLDLARVGREWAALCAVPVRGWTTQFSVRDAARFAACVRWRDRWTC